MTDHHLGPLLALRQCPFRPAAFFARAPALPVGADVSADRRDCESTITAVGMRLQAYTS